jgi:hypothetical protein
MKATTKHNNIMLWRVLLDERKIKKKKILWKERNNFESKIIIANLYYFNENNLQSFENRI